MKTLGQFKRQEKSLERQLHIAELEMEGADHDFQENPCKETWEALHKAEAKYCQLSERKARTKDIIANYDYYEFCAEEEENEAQMRQLYVINV